MATALSQETEAAQRHRIEKGPQRGNSSITVPATPVSPEIIAQCVLLYLRFPLSFRAVEEMRFRWVVADP
jgi:hypothetical protein